MQAQSAHVPHKYQSILSSLGSALGMDELSCDEDGYCAVQAGEELVVELCLEDDHVIFSAILAEFSEELVREWSMALLEANAFWVGSEGATFGVDSETGCVIQCYSQPLGSFCEETFARRFQIFLETGMEWASKLRFGDSGQDLTERPVMIDRV